MSRTRVETDSFLAGVLVAIAVVAQFDQGTIVDEIVRTAGRSGLVRVARKEGDTLGLDALRKYGHLKRGGR